MTPEYWTKVLTLLLTFAMGLTVLTAVAGQPDRDADIADTKRRCEAGSAYHCARTGSLILDIRVPDTARNAAPYFKLACDGGEGGGCVLLGNLYLSGWGVAKDPARGQQLFERATPLFRAGCDKGVAESCFGLGGAYSKGVGVSRSIKDALIYYEKACTSGSARGCEHLAYAYYNGEGVARNNQTALSLYGKACKLGAQAACSAVAELQK